MSANWSIYYLTHSCSFCEFIFIWVEKINSPLICSEIHRIFTENGTKGGNVCPEIFHSSTSNETFQLLVAILFKICMQ